MKSSTSSWAQLVMLSACESGLGKAKRADGVIGLTRAFMYAGGVTLWWSVADKPTAEVMADFYRHPRPESYAFKRDAGSPAAMISR